MRIHYSFDNPYTWTLVTIFGIRSSQKFLKCLTCTPAFTASNGNSEAISSDQLPLLNKSSPPRHTHEFNRHVYKYALHLWDAFVYISLLGLAVIPAYDEKIDSELTVFHVLFISLFTGMLSIYTVTPCNKDL